MLTVRCFTIVCGVLLVIGWIRILCVLLIPDARELELCAAVATHYRKASGISPADTLTVGMRRRAMMFGITLPLGTYPILHNQGTNRSAPWLKIVVNSINFSSSSNAELDVSIYLDGRFLEHHSYKVIYQVNTWRIVSYRLDWAA